MGEKKFSVSILLSGGGARGAYQAGVLWRMSESIGFTGKNWSIDDVCGVSAGAINASYFAGMVHRPIEMKQLSELWAGLSTRDVIRTDILSLTKIGSSFLFDTAVGPFFRNKFARSLVETDPLQVLLEKHVDIQQIQKNINDETLKSLSVTTYDYSSESSVTFVQTSRRNIDFEKFRFKRELSPIGVQHIMASCAIPLIFPSVPVEGRFLADGVIRNTAPSSPLIHLGTDKIFIVGVQKEKESAVYSKNKKPSMATSLGLVLNALFFDNFDMDLERLDYINESVGGGSHSRFRHIPFFILRPSRGIVEIARETYKSLPRQIRYLMAGLGDSRETLEVASYLLFESEYTARLVKLGYQDFKENEQKFLQFLHE